MDIRQQKAFVTKRINSLKEAYEFFLKGEDYAIDFVQQYVYDGTEQFQITAVVFGEEEIMSYDSLDIIKKYAYRYIIPKSIIEFHAAKKQQQYNQLLIAYYYDALLQIKHLKNNSFAPAILHTDLSLSTIFCTAFFPHQADLVGQQLINFFVTHEERLKVYSPNLEFGYSSTVYLAAFMLEYIGLHQKAEQVRVYCRNGVHEAYEKAINNLFSEDDELVINWMNQLTDFHLKNSRDDLTLPFNDEQWQYFPVEIIALLTLRKRKGLSVPAITRPLLIDFLPFIGQEEPVLLDDFTGKLEQRILNTD